jgi:hypothetical protein
VLVVKNGVEDFTCPSTDVGNFTELEIYIGCISTCLPTLAPSFRKEKLAAEVRNRIYYISRSIDTSGKSAKKSYGDSQLMTNESFEPMNNRENASGSNGVVVRCGNRF